MSVEMNKQAPSTMPMSVLPATYRPARPSRGPGRWFRACAGISEEILDWAPSERARYTGLGVIVFNTGCLAAFAMFTALGKIVAAPPVFLVPVALVWGWMIFSVDRWLITSTHGVHGVSRLLILIPRLLLAILLAFTIAEPLTLRIFQNSLDSQVKTTRTTQLVSYESQLQSCNPVSGQWIGSPGCEAYHLTVANPPYGDQQKLAAAKSQEADLAAQLATDQTRQQSLTTTAQDECAGTSAPGSSGAAGDGPRCKADWAAEKAQATITTAKQAQLAAVQDTVGTLIQQTGAEQGSFATELNSAIQKKVAAKKADLGQVGIIDEWTALEQLSAQSAFVFFGHWLLVLVMLALDCLPVLAKLMSGSSAYDRLLADQIASDERIYTVDLRLREDTATLDKEVEIYLAEMTKRDRKRSLDRAERVRHAKSDTDGLDDVRALAAQWIRDAQADGTS
jgi:hypothetical protein